MKVIHIRRKIRAVAVRHLQFPHRPALSKGCLNPDSADLRDFASSSSSAFPFVCRGSGGEPHDAEWYQTNVRTSFSSPLMPLRLTSPGGICGGCIVLLYVTASSSASHLNHGTLISCIASLFLGKQGIVILSSCQAVSVDLDQKYLKVKRVAAGGNGQLVFGDTIKVGDFNARSRVNRSGCIKK